MFIGDAASFHFIEFDRVCEKWERILGMPILMPFQGSGWCTKMIRSWNHCYNSFFYADWRWIFFVFHWIWPSLWKMRAHFLNALFADVPTWWLIHKKTTFVVETTAIIPSLIFIGDGFLFVSLNLIEYFQIWAHFLAAVFEIRVTRKICLAEDLVMLRLGVRVCKFRSACWQGSLMVLLLRKIYTRRCTPNSLFLGREQKIWLGCRPEMLVTCNWVFRKLKNSRKLAPKSCLFHKKINNIM